VLKNKDFISFKVFSKSSKLWSFISLHGHQKKAQRYHLPHNSTSSVANSLPTSIQIDYSSRHDPRQPKSRKHSKWHKQPHNEAEDGPNSLFLLYKQHQSTTMTCRFQRLSMVKIFPRARWPPKNGHSQWNLSTPNTFATETDTIMTIMKPIRKSYINCSCHLKFLIVIQFLP